MSNFTKVPAIPAPPGHVAFGNDETLWKWNVVCVAICLVFTTVPFVLRVYVRAFIRREWLFEDYMACAAWGGLVTYCSLMTTVMSNHGGVHGWNLTKKEVQGAIFWFNITSIEYGIEMLICKLTILMIYRRVFVPHRWSSFDIVLRVLEVIMICFYFSITVVKIFECEPRARIWDRELPGTCININAMLSTSGMFNFVTDVLILLVPIKSVWNLKMKKSRKIRVVLVFTFGLIGPIFSLIGFLVRERISHSPDATYNQPLVLLWGTAEVSTGVICICIPPLSILFTSNKHKQGPTQSILNGGSNQLSATQQSRRKVPLADSDDDLINADYLELKDGTTYTVGIERPRPTHVIGISGGAPSDDYKEGGQWPLDHRASASVDEIEDARANNIVKTVRIEQTYQ